MDIDSNLDGNSTQVSIINTEKIKKQRRKVDKLRFLFPDELQKILDIANERETYNILVLLNTGARINEARHILPQDLEEDRKYIYLRVTKVRAKLKETVPQPRRIPISSKIFRYMKKNISNHDKLFYTTSSFRKMFQRLANKAGIKDYQDLSAHNLRKTFGTWMLALGIDGFKVSQHLGHDPNTLRRHYASPDIFNSTDKDIMREIFDDLPPRMRPDYNH